MSALRLKVFNYRSSPKLVSMSWLCLRPKEVHWYFVIRTSARLGLQLKRQSSGISDPYMYEKSGERVDAPAIHIVGRSNLHF